MTSGIIRVFCTLWFDSGYMLDSVLEAWKNFTYFLLSGGLREMTSCLSPYSVLSLVRHRIHALRKSMELSVHLQVVVIPVITQRQIPMVLVTKEIIMLLGGGPDVQKAVFPTVAVPVSSLTCPLLRTTGLGGVAGAVPARCGRRCGAAATSSSCRS